MTDIERVDPPQAADEATTLVAFLDYHRQTLRIKTAGLDSVGLNTTLGPSTMTLGGMLKHLACVEESWFSEDFLGHEMGEPWRSVDWAADRDWSWHSAAEDAPDALLALWQRSVALADAIVDEALTGEGLDRLSVRTDRDTGQPWTLRWILVHMIEEYARHNGHADLIRESIDGQTGE